MEKDISRSVALLNFHWENVNFGAVLTAYALNRAVNDLGYSAQNVDYVPGFPWIEKEAPNPLFDDFRRRHLPMTERIRAGVDLSFLNDRFSIFVVGSDQVWRPEFIRGETEAYLLEFAGPDKIAASYAASFGTDSLALGDEEREEWRLRLGRFDRVTVREDSGVALCREMGVKASQVADPVFLLGREDWESLAGEFRDDGTAGADEVVCYTIDPSIKGDVDRFVLAHADEIGASRVRDITWNTGVPEWLWRMSRARLVLTDSYHASCFALIFGRPFACVNGNAKTQTRMKSLFSAAGVEGRLYSEFSEVPASDVSREQSPKEAAALVDALGRMRADSLSALRDILSGPGMTADVKLAAWRAVQSHRRAALEGFLRRTRARALRYRLLSLLAPGGKYGEKNHALGERRRSALEHLTRLREAMARREEPK